MEYELMYLVGEGKKEELPRIKEEVAAIVTKAGGTITGDTIEFDQKLAYEIKHTWRGTYIVGRFTLPDKDTREEGLGEDELPQDIIGEVTRQLNLHKDLLRYIIVNAEELPPLADYVQKSEKAQKEEKQVLKEKGEKIDGKLEKVLKI